MNDILRGMRSVEETEGALIDGFVNKRELLSIHCDDEWSRGIVPSIQSQQCVVIE
jgi:hypothetical protein